MGKRKHELDYASVEIEVLGIDKAANICLLRELWREKEELLRENDKLKKLIKNMKEKKD